MYNMSYKMSSNVGGILADYVSNKYKLGPMTSSSLYELQAAPFATGSATGDPSIYMSNNVGWHQPTASGDQWLMAANSTGENGTQTYPMTTSRRRLTPQSALTIPITALTPSAVESTVLAGVGASAYVDCSGAWVASRDTVTSRLVTQYTNNSGISALITNESQVGGFATIPAATACSDKDRDGMPDVWEEARGYNPNSSSNRNFTGVGGYTMLENYINGE
jgi:hypothetical protein